MEPASWRRRSARRGKHSKQKSRIRFQRGARLAAERAEQEILLDGEAREQAAAFRHQRDAEIDDLLGGAADEIVLFAVDLDRRCGRRAGARSPSRISSMSTCRCRWCRAAPRFSPALTLSDTSSSTRTAP
jgi:hypothetical protein